MDTHRERHRHRHRHIPFKQEGSTAVMVVEVPANVERLLLHGVALMSTTHIVIHQGNRNV